MIIVAPCWFAFYPWLYSRQLRSRVRKLVREGQNRGILGTHTMTLSPNELAYRSEWGHGVLYWPVVERIDETENHVFVFVSSMYAFAIPKRDFETVQECEEFVQTARRYREEAGAPGKGGG